MYCSNCGTSLTEDAQICPQCQHPVASTPVPEAKKKWPAWLKWMVSLICAGIILALLLAVVATDPQDSLEKHFSALKSNQITEAYYDYTTKDFQSAVALDKFKDFIKNNESLFKGSSPLIEEESPEGNLQVYRVTFMLGDQKAVQLDYLLKSEGDSWKIQDIRLAKEAQEAAGQVANGSFDSAELVNVIVKLLHNLKKGDVQGSYENLTAKEFKEGTTLETFKQFLKQNPIFTNNPTPTFSTLKYQNGVANFKGTLTTADHKVHEVEFDLIQENGVWKILDIQLQHEKESAVLAYFPTEHPLEMEKILIGSQIDLQGVVLNSTSSIKGHKESIYVNLFIKAGHPGSVIKLVLHHVDSHSKTTPFLSSVKTKGSSVLDFVFTPPASGWPKGNYELIASSPDSEPLIVPFKIE